MTGGARASSSVFMGKSDVDVEDGNVFAISCVVANPPPPPPEGSTTSGSTALNSCMAREQYLGLTSGSASLLLLSMALLSIFIFELITV